MIGGEKSCDEKKKTMSTSNEIWIFSITENNWWPVTLNN